MSIVVTAIKRRKQVGAGGKDRIVDREAACYQAGAASFGPPQAQQANDIDGIGVELLGPG